MIPFIFISIIGYYNWKLFSFIDINIWEYVKFIRTEELTKIFKVITFFGEKKVLFIISVLVILLLIFLKKYKLALFYFTSSFFGALLLNKLIKNIYLRPRPFYENNIIDNLLYVGGYSYPSGHSMGAVIIYVSLFYILYKLFKVKTFSFLFLSLATILSFLIAISRVYLGVHYPTDIISGFCLGFSICFFNIYFFEKLK